MDEKFYKKLLAYASSILSKERNSLFEKEDLVHGAWDFIDTDFISVTKSITKYYKSINPNAIIVSIDSTKDNFKYEEQKQCKKCLNILPISFFPIIKNTRYINRICKQCKNKRTNELYALSNGAKRERLVAQTKKYRHDLKDFYIVGLLKKEGTAITKEAIGLKRQSIIEKRKQLKTIQASELKDRTRNERQRRYWANQKELLTDKYIIKVICRRNKTHQPTEIEINEKRQSIIKFRQNKLNKPR